MAKQKKILIVNDFTLRGGVEYLVRILCAEWHNKFDITIMTESFFPDFYQYFSKDVKWKRFCWYKITRFSWINNIYKKIYMFWFKTKYSSYDCAIAIKDNHVFKIIDMLKCNNKIGWFHTDVLTNKISQEVYKNKDITFEMMKRFNTIFCVSKKCMESVIKVYGDPKNLYLAPNPLNKKEVIKKSKIAIELPKKKHVRFVSVGTLVKEKGYLLLLDSCKKLINKGYKFELWIVGDGPLKELFEDEIQNNNLKCIKLWGWQSNPYPIIRACDWFISASYTEGCFTFANQEAAYLHLPLILSRCPDVEDFIGDNEYGLIVEQSVESVYCTMKKVLDNPNIYTKYKKKIIDRAKTLDYKNRISNIEKLLFVN